ncbi:putative phosphosugar-binding protein [Leucobacter luti]|uniref:sugar isomerase domain-containing protein n=1 Tax=Leucobacter luti TaxID=340320 RepID=UPI001046BB06|nr:SIS domain-containing protein [Leucobacter luti]MCW2288129.1 putative phosphosugar-binding protein [Leucobacter luti]TCK45709.1 putative phosphosugar-binding protein [Leucobacter luti]
MSIATGYFDDVIAKLARVRDTQDEAIAQAAEICADTIANDGLVFTFGTGHGGFAALEMFPRTGGVTGFRPIVESSIALMHHVLGDQGTAQYRFLHTREGYGNAILRSHQIKEGDALILFSHSGINAVILDMAVEFKERGLKVIAVTSVPHSSQVESRHSSGHRLYEIADVVIDTGIPLEDASQFIDGLEFPVGPTSTSIAVAVGHAINASTSAALVARGETPMIMVNTNSNRTKFAHQQNDRNYAELWRRLRSREFSAPEVR